MAAYLIQSVWHYRLQQLVAALEAGETDLQPPPQDKNFDPLKQQPLTDIAELVARLQASTGNVASEWRMANYIGTSTVSAMIARIMNAATIAESLEFWVQYAPLVTNAVIVHGEKDKRGAYVISHSVAEPGNPLVQFCHRALFALVTHYFFLGFQEGMWRPRLMAEPKTLEALIADINGKFDFINLMITPGEGRITVPADVASIQLRQCDPVLIQSIEQELQRRLEMLPGAQTLKERVRDYLLRTRQFDLSQDDMCAQLNVEPRTFRRTLQQEGTTFSTIQRDLRKERALYLVSETSTPLKLVAIELAYNSDASFCMAFKTWTGMTPGAFRQQGRSQM